MAFQAIDSRGRTAVGFAGVLVVGLLAAGCDHSGPSLVSAPDPSGGGHVAIVASQFDKRPGAICAELGRAIVPHARKPEGTRTTAGQEVQTTRVVTGHIPAPWAALAPEQPLVSCAWLSNDSSDLTGLYIVKRGAGLRSTGTYIGTAVIDRTGRWAPDETIFFDDYD